MAATLQPRALFTAAEYLRLERDAEFKSDYVNGHIHMRAGANVVHNIISGNCLTFLVQQLRSRPGEVFGSDMKVRIDQANVFRYPDVSGLCGPLLFHDQDQDAYCNPSVIIEVLSPSTEMLDRGEKFMLYRLLETLTQYVLVRQDRMEVEVFTRDDTGWWTSVVYNEAPDSFHLRSLGCSLTLAEIYEKVDFA